MLHVLIYLRMYKKMKGIDFRVESCNLPGSNTRVYYDLVWKGNILTLQ